MNLVKRLRRALPSMLAELEVLEASSEALGRPCRYALSIDTTLRCNLLAADASGRYQGLFNYEDADAFLVGVAQVLRNQINTIKVQDKPS